MGTDIHGVFQQKTQDGWEDIPSLYEQNRHYQLFAVLGGVRNGYGFAGIPTGEPVVPIASCRGIPEDFTMDGDAHPVKDWSCLDSRRAEYREADDPLEIWMGDHSYSWASGGEMLAWRGPTVVKVGILSRAEYEKWDKKSPPESYSGGVWGGGVITVNNDEISRQTPGWTYIRCHWEQPLGEELAYFFDEIRRLVAEYGEIRFVFGFDS